MNERPAARWALLVAATLVWAALPRIFDQDTAIAYALPGYAALLVAVLLAADRAWLWPRLAPTRRALLAGLAGGALMTAATYPVYGLASALYPELAARVAVDYAMLPSEDALAYVPRLLVVVLAEELLFRGSWLHGARTPVAAAAVAMSAYAFAQLGWGSFAVLLASAMCGSLWLLQALLTHSLLAPLITHAIWSTVVLLLLPLG